MGTVGLLTTSSAARRLAVAEGTIRHWVRTGRLSPMAVTESGMNLFDSPTIDRLAAELAAKRPVSARA